MAKIREASKFDRAQINKMVFDQSLEKIERDNMKGLNLTDIMITLLGEVAIAEQAIRNAQDLGHTEKLEELYRKANRMKEL